jgi:hypothetical protein
MTVLGIGLLLNSLLVAARPLNGYAEDGFAPIFDGQSLAGWEAPDPSFWSVRDGAITATITPEHFPLQNQYLVWRGSTVQDFELKLQMRILGSTTADTNGGFQFRSRQLPDGDVAGYQVDNNFGQPWKVRLYDEFGRHDLALEGEQATFTESGERQVAPLTLDPQARDFQLDQWHEYHLIADGRDLQLAINGRVVCAVRDDDTDSFEPSGILALQLHTGPPMVVQFRGLRIKTLPARQVLSEREQLLAAANLHWQLGERTNAHQPPLRAEGTVQQVAADATNATSFVARLDPGHFDAQEDLNQPRRWNATSTGLTVFVRALMEERPWSHTFFSKQADGSTVNFRLFTTDDGAAESAALGWEIQTEAGRFNAKIPSESIETWRWHDILGRYDGERLELWVDGKPLASAPAHGSLVGNDGPLLIGAEQEGQSVSRMFRGQMADVALWNRALSGQELRLISRLPAESLVEPGSADGGGRGDDQTDDCP